MIRSLKPRILACEAKLMVVVQRGRVLSTEGKIARRMGAAMNGATAAIREERWKQSEGGCVLEVEKPGAPEADVQVGHAVLM
jgi:hypothetical protein